MWKPLIRRVLFVRYAKTICSIPIMKIIQNQRCSISYFGERLGEKIKRQTRFSDLEALIPVPLHPQKEFLRGYNQSQLLAEGIASELRIPIRGDLLKRVVFTESQTKKG